MLAMEQVGEQRNVFSKLFVGDAHDKQDQDSPQLSHLTEQLDIMIVSNVHLKKKEPNVTELYLHNEVFHFNSFLDYYNVRETLRNEIGLGNERPKVNENNSD